MNHLSYRLYVALCASLLFTTCAADAVITQPVTHQAIKALALTQTCVDCTLYKNELCKLFASLHAYNKVTNTEAITPLVDALNNHPDTIDAAALKNGVITALDILEQHNDKPEDFDTIKDAAQKALLLCNSRKMRENKVIEYEPPMFTAPQNITRAAADAWVVTGPTGGTVTFDPGTGSFTMNQNIAIGSAVSFNSVTSATGSALALDAATGQNVNIGTSSDTAVNIATAGAPSVTIGAGAGTTTLSITGATPTLTGTTSILLDGPAVNIGTVNNSGNTIIIGKNAATATTSTSLYGATINAGTGTSTTAAYFGTGDNVATIGIGKAATSAVTVTGTTIGVTGSTGINLTGTTTLKSGSQLLLEGSTSGYSGFVASATTTINNPWILPAADGADGQVLSTNGSRQLTWSSTFSNSSRVDAYRGTTDQTIAGAVAETIVFNTEVIDPGADFNIATGEYTVPANGDYWINAQVCVRPLDVGTKKIEVVRTTGGALTGKYQSYIVVPTLSSSGDPAIYETHMINLGCLIPLVANDVIVIQYTGTTNDVIYKDASHLTLYLVAT